MNSLQKLINMQSKLVIGLMGGTSVDGIDAALIRIDGAGLTTNVKQLAFATTPFPPKARERILALASGEAGGAKEICLMSSLLGRLYADACLELCKKAGVSPNQIDLVGSHGQTVFHIPKPTNYAGFDITGTLQIGDVSPISEALGCPVVSDFRVRDMAAGGQGAPLVPYTEFLLYRSENITTALQNIGGIGNITILPAGCSLEDVTGFDTGPGNMLIDKAMEIVTDGKLCYDESGRLAGSGKLHVGLLDYLLKDPYLTVPPPKTTGREYYNDDYVRRIMDFVVTHSISNEDLIATITCFTSESIRIGIEQYCPIKPDRLIIGGGGSHNLTLISMMKKALPDCDVITNEDIGLSSDAKEAVAFAVLANEAIHEIPNNAPAVTGARHPVVMGKVSF